MSIKDVLSKLASQLEKGVITEQEAVNKAASLLFRENSELYNNYSESLNNINEIKKEKELHVVILIQCGIEERNKSKELFERICKDHL